MLVDALLSTCRPESVDVATVLAQSMQEEVEEEGDKWEEEDRLEEDKGQEALLQKRASEVS